MRFQHTIRNGLLEIISIHTSVHTHTHTATQENEIKSQTSVVAVPLHDHFSGVDAGELDMSVSCQVFHDELLHVSIPRRVDHFRFRRTGSIQGESHVHIDGMQPKPDHELHIG